MTERPTRATPGGRAYLDLRKAASSARRPTDELLQLYALEGLLDRLSGSPHAGRFVLKGGALLAAFDARRPTRDLDFAAIDVTNDLGEMQRLVKEVIAVPAKTASTSISRRRRCRRSATTSSTAASA